MPEISSRGLMWIIARLFGEYNAIEKIGSRVDSWGNVLTFAYDQSGQVIETRNTDGTISRIVYDTNGRGYITQNAHVEGSPATGSRSIYDSTGRVIRTEQLENVVVSIANGNSSFVRGDVVSSTSTVYDAAGQAIKKIDANGNVTQYEFDACGRNIATIDTFGNRTEFTYDAAGRQLSMKDANGNTVSYEYDALGRKIKTVYPDGTYSTVKYNNLGQKTGETDTAGLTTKFEYNDAGRLSAVVKPEVNGETPRWEYSYNQYGQRISIKDPKGNVTNFTYDYAGRQLSRTLPMGQKETVEYNTFAQLVKQTDFKGQSVEYIYDNLGRKTALKYFAASSSSATEEISFTYDDLGRTKTIVTPQGTTENTYNNRGELIQVSTPEGSINYAYDVKTGAKTRVWTLNSDIRYTYDAMNRLKTVEVHKRNGVELGTPEVTTYDYTKIGSRASVSLPNGITTSYQYDSLNRLTNLTHKKADALISSYTYNLLPAGRRSAVTEITPEGSSQINYTYDNLYRLTNETRTGVNPFTASYAYDVNSNRTQKVETVAGVAETINYEYNANDQLLSEVSSANGTTSYQYDANGSLTSKVNVGKFSYQYGYDLRNRLASANITRKEGLQDVAITSSYAYNTAGIRTRAEQTINGVTQNRYFLLDSGHTGYAQVFEETSSLGGNLVCSYVLGDDVLSQNVGGVTSHLLYDGHGSTRQLAGDDGGVTANYAYDAYGKMLGGNPGVTDGKQSATDLLYAGEQFDPGLQMEYLRARYYDQDNGRFNRLDLFEGNSEEPQSLHKYAYAHCDPVAGIDPSGLYLAAVLGTFIHAEWSSEYISLHWPDTIITNRALPNMMLRPDIINVTRKEVYEIKPLSAYGLSGHAQLARYIAILNASGEKYIPGVSYSPVCQLRSLVSVPGYFYIQVMNVAGVLYYKVITPNYRFKPVPESVWKRIEKIVEDYKNEPIVLDLEIERFVAVRATQSMLATGIAAVSAYIIASLYFRTLMGVLI